MSGKLFAILQKYDFSSKSQRRTDDYTSLLVVCDTAKVRFFKQITTPICVIFVIIALFAILQKYDFSSKSQQAAKDADLWHAVCDTAKVRFFKQITTLALSRSATTSCLRYCKSTIFQANHNTNIDNHISHGVVCDTAKVRFFKQITTQISTIT